MVTKKTPLCILFGVALLLVCGCQSGGTDSASKTNVTLCTDSPGVKGSDAQAVVDAAIAAGVPVSDPALARSGNSVVIVSCGGQNIQTDTTNETTTTTNTSNANDNTTHSGQSSKMLAARIIDDIDAGDVGFIELHENSHR